MSDIFFKCEACGKHLVADDAGIGAAINCPDCNAAVRIPEQTASTTDNGQDTRECPKCGTRFSGRVLVCSHCGHDFLTGKNDLETEDERVSKQRRQTFAVYMIWFSVIGFAVVGFRSLLLLFLVGAEGSESDAIKSLFTQSLCGALAGAVACAVLGLVIALLKQTYQRFSKFYNVVLMFAFIVVLISLFVFIVVSVTDFAKDAWHRTTDNSGRTSAQTQQASSSPQQAPVPVPQPPKPPMPRQPQYAQQEQAPQIYSESQPKAPPPAPDPTVSLKQEVIQRIQVYYAKPPKRNPANNGVMWDRIVDLKYDVQRTQSLVSPYVGYIWMRDRPFIQFDGEQTTSTGDHEYQFTLAFQDGHWAVTDARWRFFLKGDELLSDWEPADQAWLAAFIREAGLDSPGLRSSGF